MKKLPLVMKDLLLMHFVRPIVTGPLQFFFRRVTTLHCAPCHTHDRDGMNVLVIRPAGTLRKKAKQEATTLARKVAPRLISDSAEGAPAQPRLIARIRKPPEKPTEVRLLKPEPSEDDDEERNLSIRLKQGITTLRAIKPRTVLGKLRWRSHIAAKLRNPPEDL